MHMLFFPSLLIVCSWNWNHSILILIQLFSLMAHANPRPELDPCDPGVFRVLVQILK